MVIGIDFDGTIVPRLSDGYCDLDTGAESVIRDLIRSGHTIILFTCRNNSAKNPYNLSKNGDLRKETSLQEALRWFSERGLNISGVNHSPHQLEEIGPSSKPLVDVLIDDTALGIKLRKLSVTYTRYDDGSSVHNYNTYCVDWMWVENELKKQGIL